MIPRVNEVLRAKVKSTAKTAGRQLCCVVLKLFDDLLEPDVPTWRVTGPATTPPIAGPLHFYFARCMVSLMLAESATNATVPCFRGQGICLTSWEVAL